MRKSKMRKQEKVARHKAVEQYKKDKRKKNV